jgi:serine/threonine protein kinase
MKTEFAAKASSGTVTSAPEVDGNTKPFGLPRLPSRYRDHGRIAAGSFGEVRRVHDTQLDRMVAMKLLRADVAGGAQIEARFLAETKLTAGLEHPGIVAVHDRGRLEDGRMWFTMREVRGQTLGEVIAEVHAAAGPDGFRETASGWTFRRLADAFARVCQAVAYAHRRGIVHRDIKPDNLMTGELGEVMVMDWGLGRRIDSGEPDDLEGMDPTVDPSSAHLTRRGDVLGTPAYMPPEQARGQRELHGLPSDVYALGAVLYHLLSGHPPHTGEALRSTCCSKCWTAHRCRSSRLPRANRYPPSSRRSAQKQWNARYPLVIQTRKRLRATSSRGSTGRGDENKRSKWSSGRRRWSRKSWRSARKRPRNARMHKRGSVGCGRLTQSQRKSLAGPWKTKQASSR